MFGLSLTSRVTSTEKASNINDYQLHQKGSFAHMTQYLGSGELPRMESTSYQGRKRNDW